MALFKIYNNFASGKDITQQTTYNQGYCYLDANTMKLWVDTTSAAAGRKALNAANADTVNSHTVAIDVPADAKFTDTKYSAASGGGLSLSGTAFSIAAISGLTAATYGPTQSSATNAVQGTSIAIPKITINTKGQITGITTVTFTAQDHNTTYSAGTGITLDGTTFKMTTQSVSDALNLLSEGTSAAQGADYLIAQYAGGGTTTKTYHRRSVSNVVNATVVKAALGTNTTHGGAYLRKDGTWAVPPNDNTTYTFESGTGGFKVTPSGGSAQTVTITITNNITGSGTSGYLAKFNGANTITNGPALGSSTTTYLRNDGQWVAPPNTNTTYTFGNGTNGFTVTPSGGTAQTVTVTPSIANNITGSGTSGYIAKFNGANTITNGPAFGSATTTYLRNDGSWATPPNTNTTYTFSGGTNSFTVTPSGGSAQTVNITISAGSHSHSNYVLKAGDTMTGGLSITKASEPYVGVEDTTVSGLYASLMVGTNHATHGMYSSGYSTNGTSLTTSAKWIIYRGMDGEAHSQLKIYGAVWNDYAEYRAQYYDIEPGRVVRDLDNGHVIKTEERLIAGAQVVSDTFGFAIGKTENCQTPLAVSGRVLVYPYRNRYEYHAGMAVCSAPNGTVDIMTREEMQQYPDCIIGIVSEIPNYDTWGEDNIQVNNRIWIKVR